LSDSHIIKIPQHIHTFKAGVTCYILLEFGSSETYSVMRLFINDKEVGRCESESTLDLIIDKTSKPILGAADLNGKNYGKNIMYIINLKGALTRKQRDGLFAATAKLHKDLGRY
jgi:hypothetical protein